MATLAKPTGAAFLGNATVDGSRYRPLTDDRVSEGADFCGGAAHDSECLPVTSFRTGINDDERGLHHDGEVWLEPVCSDCIERLTRRSLRPARGPAIQPRGRGRHLRI
jgi:hypothetical protein